MWIFQVRSASSSYSVNICGSPTLGDCSPGAVCRTPLSSSARVVFSLHTVILESNVVKVVYVQEPSPADCLPGN